MHDEVVEIKKLLNESKEFDMQKVIHLKDAENLTVIVRVDPSVADPTGEFPAVSQVYRVVANSYGPTLQLVPLTSSPVRLRETETGEILRGNVGVAI